MAGAGTAGQAGRAGSYFDDEPFPSGGAPSRAGSAGAAGSSGSAGGNAGGNAGGALSHGGSGTCFVVDDPGAVCAVGSFDHDGDPSTACRAWAAVCAPGSYLSAAPSASSDRQCTPCSTGTFSATEDAPSCLAWSTCQAGSTALSVGSATSDRRCSCANGGQAVSLPNGVQTCECPAGTWGSSCVLTTRAFTGPYCVLKSDGRPLCYAGDSISRGSPPDGPFQSVSEPCGLRADGTLACWGADGPGPAPSGTFTSFSAVQTAACAVRANGTLACFGAENPILHPPSGTFQNVSVGYSASCAVRTSGELVCWGDPPIELEASKPPGKFASVAMNGIGACAIRADGSWTCFGPNDNDDVSGVGPARSVWEVPSGMCELLTNGKVRCPEPILPDHEYLAVGGSNLLPCGLTPSGKLECVPASNPWEPVYLEVKPPSALFTSIVGVGDGACGLKRDHSLECWNFDRLYLPPPSGELEGLLDGLPCALRSDGTLECWNAYFPSEGLPKMRSFSVASSHRCWVTLDGTLSCSGTDDTGDAFPPCARFKSVSTGRYGTCALRDDDTAICWSGSTATLLVPAGTFRSVSLGWEGDFACGLRSDGTLACWGDDTAGRATPPAGRFIALATGATHACAVSVSNDITCWGDDADGQASPRPGKYQSVSAKGSSTCALTTNGRAVCWGRLGYGE